MKKVLFLSFVALCFAATTRAQSADTTAHQNKWLKGMRPGTSEREAKELNLTGDQKTQFKAIDDAQWSSMDSIGKTGASSDDMRKSIMGVRKNSDAQKRAILTTDQQTKWDAMMQKRQEKMKGMGMGSKSGGN